MVNKIKIKEEYCKGCGFCVEICPQGIIKQNNKTNERGYIIPEVTNQGECIACKKCELICPEMAVTVIEEEEDS
jgi:2-oxoglutarate ferredoxin oxidoreductase subunit delta